MPQSIDLNKVTAPIKNFSILKLFTAAVMLLASGIYSTYLYYRFPGNGGILFPGILYTSSSIIIILITCQNLKVSNLLKYFVLMILTYVAVWFLTMASSWAVIICGLGTAGLGALATFILTDKFITKIKYNKIHVFIIGGCAFLLTDILYFIFSYSYDKTPIEYIFETEVHPSVLFLELFIFWQLLVGIKLFLTLSKQ